METLRIAVLDSYDQVLCFIDNNVDKDMRYFDEELHTYLKGSAYTFSFSTFTDHEDAANLVVGNKLAFKYKLKDYYLNIVNVEKGNKKTIVTAYGLSLELTNEETASYSGNSMSFVDYFQAMNFETEHLKIGLNEVSDKRISYTWDSSDTILGRLFSLANVFDAELEFSAVLNNNYALNHIDVNVYRAHSDEFQGMGQDKRRQILRYGKEVRGITKTSDITELYTAIRPTGKDGLTIASVNNVEYDENGNVEFESRSGNINIYAPQSRDRFPSNLVRGAQDRYIVKLWEYDTDNVNTLYGQALAQLKKLCEPQVKYEVDGYVEADIGDTFTIEDSEYIPTLYVEARVSEQSICFTDPSQCKTVFDNFNEVQSQISSNLIDKMNQLIEENKAYQASISSTAGIIFKSRDERTVLTAIVKDKGDDVTDKFEIIWYKDDMELYRGTSINVNGSDFPDKAVYRFDAILEYKVRATTEVTCMFIQEGSSSVLHIAYADDANGTNLSFTDSSKPFIGQYVDNNTVASTDPTKYLWTEFIGPKGDKGDAGPQGEPGSHGLTSYFHVKYSLIMNPTDPADMTETPSTFIGTYVDFVEYDSNDPTKYTWSRFQGVQGEQGIPGTNGTNGITYYWHIKYSNDGGQTFTANNGEDAGDWQGTYVDTIPGDSTDVTKYKWVKIKGDKGEDGVGISGRLIYYLATDQSSGITIESEGWTITPQQLTPINKYLWSYELTTYSDGSKSNTDPAIIGVYGDKGDPGEDGTPGESVTIVSQSVTYQIGSSGTEVPQGTWSTNIPSANQGEYLWARTIITYSDGTSTTTYMATYIGKDGSSGHDGQDGTGVESIHAQFYLSTSKTEQTGGSWQYTAPNWQENTYMWTRWEIKYINPPSTIYTTPSVDSAWESATKVQVNLTTYQEKTDESIRQVATRVSETEVELETVGEKITTVEQAQSELKQDAEEFKTTVSTTYTTKSEAIDLDSKVTSAQNSLDSFKDQVVNEYAQKSELPDLGEYATTTQLTSALTQNSSSIEATIKQLQTVIDSNNSEAIGQINEILTYFRITAEGVELGRSDNPIILKQKPDRISFVQSGKEVAYISNNKLYVTDGEFTYSLRIGKFAFVPKANGSLDFKKVG